MSQQPPKEFIVYWASKFAGKSPGYSTPMYKPNMMTFDTMDAAITLRTKLMNLETAGGAYRGRVVCHVSPCIGHNDV